MAAKRTTSRADTASGRTAAPPQPIRILHLEDNADDAFLVATTLRREGVPCQINLVDSREAFVREVATGAFDLVLSDHNLPGFDGLSAFRILREHDDVIPFILVSGSLGEEAAIETIRAGVTDYVLKDRLARLAGCVQRALSEANERRERHNAEEALRRSQQLFSAALTAMAEGLLHVDTTGVVMMSNPAAARLLGFGDRSLTGMAIADALVHTRRDTGAPLTADDLQALLGIGTGTAASDAVLTIVRPDQSTVSALINTRPVAHGGAFEGTVITMHDVTERQRLQAQVIRAQKMDAVGRLSAGIAHDFNNLLVVINNYAEMVVDAAKGDQALFEQGLTIRRAGGRAAQLTQQLLAFSRQQTLKPALLDLRAVVEEMAPMLRRLIGTHIELTVIGDEQVASVNADRGQIDQVIMNLAVNARDAMPDGGRLEIAVTNSSLDSSHDNDRVRVTPGEYVELRVSDSGHGMEEATRERVFEPFFTTKEVGKGTGLGLPTVYGIVKQSGGYIWVESEVDKGTTIKVYMPSVPGVPDQAPAAAVTTPPRGLESILIVEDDEDVRTLTALMVSTAGYHVRTAPHADAALHMLEAPDEPVDLVVTDMVMPGMTGRRFAEELRARGRLSKVLYMSGYIDDQRVMAPDEHFIGKPFSSASLLRKIREVLDG